MRGACMGEKNNWTEATEDFQQIVLSFFRTHGVNISEDGSVKSELVEKARELMPQAICHYLSEKFISNLIYMKFLKNIKFSLHEVASECSIFMLAKHSEIPGYIPLGQLSFEFKKPGDVGFLVFSSKNAEEIKIPFKEFWGMKRGFNLVTSIINKLNNFCMVEYNLALSKHRQNFPEENTKISVL